MRVRDVQAFSVQYHPEAGPGPHDSRYLFADFAAMIAGGRDSTAPRHEMRGHEPHGLPEPLVGLVGERV
jgi:hypothetical protein